MQFLVALKEVLRGYIVDFDTKLEEELTRQMILLINEKFTILQQMVQSKEFSELIDEINKLEPREVTPTTKSALHYYQRCTEMIFAFRETLIKQSKECMAELAEQLPRSTDDFTNKLRFFQESLKQEQNFSLELPGLDQKLEALNIQGYQNFSDKNKNPKNPIYKEFVHKVDVYLENLINQYPVEDANWTQSLLKLCILCSQFSSGEFEPLRQKYYAQYSNMI